MSVYTTVTQQQLILFLQNYSVGKLISFTGITGGMVNTNYSVTTSQDEYILTLYEHDSPKNLAYFFDLMQHLSAKGVKTITPVKNNQQAILGTLSHKPAALIHKLSGETLHSSQVTPEHCTIIGKALAEFHLAGQSFEQTRQPPQRDIQALIQLVKKLQPKLSSTEKQLLEQEIQLSKTIIWGDLPSGLIHSDLFCDNTLFIKTNDSLQLAGILDLYDASNDAFIYDLAIVANDWCYNAQGDLDAKLWLPLLTTYHAIRPITNKEQSIWVSMLRTSALYFWIHRLNYKYFPPAGELVNKKDPDELMQKIIAYRDNERIIMEQLRSADLSA